MSRLFSRGGLDIAGGCARRDSQATPLTRTSLTQRGDPLSRARPSPAASVRPRGPDDRLQRVFGAYLGAGGSMAAACRHPGLPLKTVEGWITRGRREQTGPFADFAATVDAARERAAIELQERLSAALGAPP